jgi:aspartyl protease family protein
MREFPSSLKLATVWMLLGLALFLGISAWQARERASRFSSDGRTIEIRRDGDGHYRWSGRVEGRAVEFLVDTGATSTALPQALAERLGLQRLSSVTSSTAGGEVLGWLARADIDLDGGVRAHALRVTVLPRLEAPLLGMDILAKMRFTQHAGVMRFEPAAGDMNGR